MLQKKSAEIAVTPLGKGVKIYLFRQEEQTLVIIKSTFSTQKPSGASTTGGDSGATQKVRPQTRQVACMWCVEPL